MRHTLIDLLRHSKSCRCGLKKKKKRARLCLKAGVNVELKPFCGPIHVQLVVANLFFKRTHTCLLKGLMSAYFFFSHTVTTKRCESFIPVPECCSHKGDSKFGCETPTKQTSACPRAEVTKEPGGGSKSFSVSLLLDESEQMKSRNKGANISLVFVETLDYSRCNVVVWNTMSHTIILKFQSLEVNNDYSKSLLWIHNNNN